MAPVFARRADEFAALVEGTSTGGRDRHAQLLDGRRPAAGCPRPGSEAGVPGGPARTADGRGRHRPGAGHRPVARRTTEQRLTLRPAARRTSRDRRLAVAVGSLALLGAAASVTVGAQVALPGDTLYPMKRAIEDVRTDLAVGDARTGSADAGAGHRAARGDRGPDPARRRGRASHRGHPERLHRAGRGRGGPDDRGVHRQRPTGDRSSRCATSPATAWTGSRRWSRPCRRRPTTSWSPRRTRWSPSTTTPPPPARRAAGPAWSTSRSASPSAGLLPITPAGPGDRERNGKGRTSGQDGGGPKAPPLPLPTITGALPTPAALAAAGADAVRRLPPGCRPRRPPRRCRRPRASRACRCRCRRRSPRCCRRCRR